MATGWKGAALGALGLIALETLVQPGASGRFGALFDGAAGVSKRFIDPSVPAIPPKSSSSSASAAPAAVAAPAAPSVSLPIVPGGVLA